MKLSRLVTDIIKADADYFAKNGFITPGERERVENWLLGTADLEIQLKIANWLESDASYFGRLASSLLIHHWYLFPFMLTMLYFVPKRLRKYAEKLKLDHLQNP